jgi:hypothetical protein
LAAFFRRSMARMADAMQSFSVTQVSIDLVPVKSPAFAGQALLVLQTCCIRRG